MESEIGSLRTALREPPRPYLAILGGAKCDDSMRVARNLIQRGNIDRIAFVGVAGNLMLWVSGKDIGECNKEFIRKTRDFILGNRIRITNEKKIYEVEQQGVAMAMEANVKIAQLEATAAHLVVSVWQLLR